MSLEKRVEALEMAVASMAAQQSNTEEITDIVRKVTAGVIANALRPGGAINAAQKQAAKSHEELFCEKLDLITSLMPPLKVSGCV
ncbi:hypothetical protein OIL53_22955 [Salmonella enterica subsp. enterica serovar Senftenberg]|nr:hypothetical protein [Salmonella enterica subsp. enterica serovar Senftenberg]EEF9350458.1 hypothetical protein [Salmonella enterica]EEG2266359.1 hypothetical protein [Salmonella enterica]EEG2639821.1 hypothetical protein [Salmonella enterica]EEH1623998.1 hypothetical protein [Salmonella enterica]